MKFRAWLVFAGGVVWSLIPLIAQAALVPCGLGSDVNTFSGSISCDLCDVGQLIQNIINFMVGISIPIAVVLFGWAGILMFTSGASEPQRTKGKKIFNTVFIGFVIVISGWLVVQTILSVLVDDKFFIGGNWNQLQCQNVDQRQSQSTETVGNWLTGLLGAPPTGSSNLQPGGSQSYVAVASCPQGYSLRSDGDCKNPAGDVVPATASYVPRGGSMTGGTLSQTTLQGQLAGTRRYSAELQNICNQEGLSNCTLAQAIMAIESGGRARCSTANACGIMQVIPSTARYLDPSLRNLTDQQIRTRLNTDNTLSMQLGVRYIRQMNDQFNGDLPLVVAAYNGGPKANNPSVSCRGQRVWQCNVNDGYEETRKYVPNVINTMNILTQ